MDFLVQDQRFFLEKGDPDFSPSRNKKIIEDSIKHYAVNRKRLEDAFNDQFAERVDAVADYILYADQHDITPEKYFGNELERLQSRKLTRVIQGAKQSLGWI